jgi:hypothetical protein
MLINGSPDISQLIIQPTFDLSGTLPVVNIVNLSQGPDLAALTTWFVLYSPSGTPIHEGSVTQPDITGLWSNFSITDPWPRPFSQIEFSGAPYSLTVFVQDTTGAIYSDSNYSATICRPNGNNNLSKNFYGVASTNVQLQCQQASIYFQDQTNSSYQGLAGTLITSILRLVYPIDDTGNIPTPFVISNFSSASAPISYASKNYQFQEQIVYDYDFGYNVHVRIRYQTIDPKDKTNYRTFPVLCNIDLSPLICEFEKLVWSIETGSCGDVQAAERKLMLINPKLGLVIMGLVQPLTGIDVPKYIEEIQEIGGFTCDCCNAPTGIIPQTSSVIDGYTFSVVPVCGDISGTVTLTGTNVQINLSDKSYNFLLSSAIPTTAFSITPATTGCVKAYTFNVNIVQLSTDILTTISTNAGLVYLFNSIFTGSNSLFLSVDGKCIFTSASAFAYAFTLANIPSNTTFAVLNQITVGGTPRTLNFPLNLTNLVAFQTYLNGLGLGTFVVTNPSGQNVLISSTANPNNLSSVTYGLSGTNFIASATTTAAGYVPIAANQVVQNIINHLCGITDEEITTSQAYAITYVASNGTVQTVTVPAGSTLADFLSILVNLQDQTVENIGQTASVNCKAIQAAFPVSPAAIKPTDFLYITKGGVCAQGNFLDVFNYMLTSGILDNTTKTNFCAFVEACGAGLMCGNYSYFDIEVTTYNTGCAPIAAIDYTIS